MGAGRRVEKIGRIAVPPCRHAAPPPRRLTQVSAASTLTVVSLSPLQVSAASALAAVASAAAASAAAREARDCLHALYMPSARPLHALCTPSARPLHALLLTAAFLTTVRRTPRVQLRVPARGHETAGSKWYVVNSK